MMLLNATVGVIDDPMAGLRQKDMRAEPAGRTLAEVAPITDLPLLCQVSGIPGYILREQWGYRLQPGDIVVFTIDPPGDKSAVRSVVAIVVAAAYIYYTGDAKTGYTLGNIIAGISLGLTVSNLLLPPTLPEAQNQQAAQNVFSTSLSGNQAKLDQPIWKICGRRKVTPPFAAEPYLEYQATTSGLDNQQYYYALLAVGEGNHDIERALIGGTPISHYSDVVVSQYLAPGVQPTVVLANVSNCSAVSGSVLESGQYVGGFAACRPQRTCNAIGIDIVAPRGLGKGGAALTVAWRVETRSINDFGSATTAWAIVGTGSKTAATNTPQRWSQKITLTTVARVEVRVVRTDIKDEDTTAAHEIAWGGLRAYLAQPAPLNADTAHYEVVLRASEQLGQLAQRDIALIALGKCRTWTPGGGWGAEIYTRNPMWWLADLLTNPTWGGGYPDDRVDLQSIYELALVADARQDRFDWTFDAAMSLWDAGQLIARACRARMTRRNGVFTVARDELVTLPVTALTHRNCMPGSMRISENFTTNETPDGFVIEYEDNRTWLWTPIDCPCPGVVTMTNPVRKRIEGITGPTHAEREGLYEAANLIYRPQTTTCRTEMHGVLPAFMSAVRWQPEIYGYGQSGDVAYWDDTSLVMGLTEPPDWADVAPRYLTLIRDDGSLTTPVQVTPGPTNFDVVLPAAPDFSLVLDDGTRERPKYLLGPLVGGDEMVKVLAIKDGGKGEGGEQLYDVDGVIDDVRVHEADNALLPGPGDIQDPIDESGDAGTGGGTLLLVNLSSNWWIWGGIYSVIANDCNYELRSDGVASSSGWVPISEETGIYVTQDIANEWLQYGVAETDSAALYEVLVEYLTGYENPPINITAPNGDDGYFTVALTGSAVGSWLNLGTTRTWTIPNDTDLTKRITKFSVQIRLVGTTEVLGSSVITLSTQ